MQPYLKPSRPPLLFPIPKGTESHVCSFCFKTIWLIQHPKSGRLYPVDCDHDVAFPPTARTWGIGRSHWAAKDCASLKRRVA